MEGGGGLAWVSDGVSWICLVTGSLFCVIGGIGMLRMPDFYSRAHAAGLTDTLGAGLVFVGLMFQAGFTLITAKLVLVLAFLYLTSPVAAHALAKAAYMGGVRADCEERPIVDSFEEREA